ncbi:MAG: TlpA disulfide reductase family protein [Saprospiraceae bacterium]
MKIKEVLFLVSIFITGLSTASFSQKNSYQIEISFDNSVSDLLYLSIIDDYTKHTPESSIVDSVFVTGERVVFKGQLDYPTGGRLFFKNSDGLFTFTFLNDSYRMVMHTDSMWKTKIISGPDDLLEVEKYREASAPLFEKMNQAYKDFQNAEEIGNDTMMDNYSMLNKSYVREIDQLTGSFIQNHPDSFVSLLMFREFSQQLGIEERREYFSDLTNKNKTHPLGQRLYFELFQKDALTAEGSPAIPFLLSDAHDIFYELDDFKGKYLLMFFWATWCDRCINQFIPYRELFYKSQDKPFEIVSVSVEHEQQTWLHYLETHDLPWINLYDGKDENGWRLFEYYDNQAIPFNVLIGKDGKIVKLNVPFSELEEMLNN